MNPALVVSALKAQQMWSILKTKIANSLSVYIDVVDTASSFFKLSEKEREFFRIGGDRSVRDNAFCTITLSISVFLCIIVNQVWNYYLTDDIAAIISFLFCYLCSRHKNKDATIFLEFWLISAVFAFLDKKNCKCFAQKSGILHFGPIDLYIPYCTVNCKLYIL